MIIVRLAGGLGNQMFMYAAAKGLALRTNQELLLDTITGFEHDFFTRAYQLKYFNVDCSEASSLLSFNYPLGRCVRNLSRYVNRNILFPKCNMIREQSVFDIDQRLFSSIQNAYLEGYWQKEKYFKDFEKEIRAEFVVKIDFSEVVLNEKELIKIAGSRSVAIGVRRYQECRDPSLMRLCDENYYHQAMIEIEKKIDNPFYFIFSQDMEWVKAHLDFQNRNVFFITQKNEVNGAAEDLYLMTQCSHFIISNSTLYWWGSWLSSFSDKIVLSPYLLY